MHKLTSIAILMAAAATSAHADTITAWSFEDNAVSITNTPTASTGVGTAIALGMTNTLNAAGASTNTDDVLVGTTGTGGDTGANAIADVTHEWRIRGAGGTNVNGWSSLAAIGTQGAQFSASTTGYNTINISFDWYATTQGEANLQLQYTTDGITYKNAAINIGSNASAGLTALTNNSSVNTVNGSYISDNVKLPGVATLAGQDWFTGLSATITDPLAANDANFAIRLVNASTGADDVSTKGTALNNTSGNWRFDNVSISGTVVAAVPEPETLALLLAGLGVIGFAARRKSHAA